MIPVAMAPPAHATEPSRNGSVLLVAGEADQGIYWELIFQSLGFKVYRVGCLRDALGILAKAHDVHIIACDFQLPDGSGAAFIEQLRARSDMRLIYVILLTVSSEQVVASLRAGASDCLAIGSSYGEIRARLELAGRVTGLTRALDQKSAELDDALRILQAELTAAAKLQSALLPRSIRHQQWSIDAFYEPAGALGGDMLGVSAPIHGCIAFGLIDVVGHGTASALISCSLIRELMDRLSVQLLREHEADRLAGSEKVLYDMNRRYCELGLPGMYFTALAGVIDTRSGQLAWCQAGHPSLLLLEGQSGWDERTESGYPVGLIENAEFELHRLTLAPGAMLLAISDGMLRPTSRDPAGAEELLGRLRMAAPEPAAVLHCLRIHAQTVIGQEKDDQSALLIALPRGV